MMKTELICIKCPKGCCLSIEEVAGEITVTGSCCKLGEQYAAEEMKDPKRFIASTVILSVGNRNYSRLPVAVSKPVAKRLIFDIIKEIKKVKISALPVRENQIIIENICNSGADLISTRDIS